MTIYSAGDCLRVKNLIPLRRSLDWDFANLTFSEADLRNPTSESTLSAATLNLLAQVRDLSGSWNVVTSVFTAASSERGFLFNEDMIL